MCSKKQVGEKRSTICTHRYGDCLLKNMSTKDNKYGVNQKLEHVDDISFRELFDRIRVVFYKIRSVPSEDKVSVSMMVILFKETQLDQLP